jgi:hypothetical protein
MSVASSSKTVSIIPFDGKDFALWKLKVKATLKGQGWYGVLEPSSKIKIEHDVYDSKSSDVSDHGVKV